MQSIRWRLPVTYALIALLTAVVLGAALIFSLRGYYIGRERAFLQKNAISIAGALTPVLESAADAHVDLVEPIRFVSVMSQTRVQLYDSNQNPIADSGAQGQSYPSSLSVITISMKESGQDVIIGFPAEQVEIQAGGGGAAISAAPPAGSAEAGRTDAYPDTVQSSITPNNPPGSGRTVPLDDRLRFTVKTQPDFQLANGQEGAAAEGTKVVEAIVPLAGTMYGFELQGGSGATGVYSDQIYRQEISDSQGKNLGWVVLSNGPAYGREIVEDVARGWLAASLIAILLAGVVGYLVSRRMTEPLLALANVAGCLAEGNLSARADITTEGEIGLLGSAFNEMANRVEGTVRTLRHFASDAAHELRTPLTALHTNLELASTSPDPSVYLAHANEQLQRIENLTTDLLDLSRIETDTPGNENADVHLQDLFLEMNETFASQAEQAEIVFSIDLPDRAVVVPGKKDQLQRAVTNLVENALKFTPPGGSVTVGLRQTDAEALIWVEDTGIGIPPEDVPLIFNRFHRGRNIAGYAGSGLGLSIVQAIVERHHGRIEVESLDGGTRFRMSLPAKDDSR
jgi:signal transduction histidine kinase